MAESGLHLSVMVSVIGRVKHFFRKFPWVYCIGNIFLYYEEGNPDAHCAPDVMVVKDVPKEPERTSFFTWVEPAVPCFILELTSKSTKDEDLRTKYEIYERIGVREYFLFDPNNEYLPQQLMGFKLVAWAENGDDPLHTEVEHRYEKMLPGPDGSLISELELRLVPEGSYLALYDMRTGKRLPEMSDLDDELARMVL